MRASSLLVVLCTSHLAYGSFNNALEARTDLTAAHHENPLADIDLPDNEFGATVLALLYGYPFSAYSATFRDRLGLEALGTNGFISLQRTQAAGDDSVVRPNVDTIYGISILDLSKEDVVVTVPPMQPDRYYLFAFYDPYGDNYASVGSLYWDRPGDYLLRPSLKANDAGQSSRDCESYAGCINAPTLEGLMLVRVELKNNRSDVKIVDEYLNKIKVKGVNKHSPTAPPFKPVDLEGLSQQKTLRSLQLTARLADRNPPQDPILAATMPFVLRSAGIHGGEYHQSPKVNLTKVTSAWQGIIDKFYANPQNNIPLNNGWSYLSPSFSGSFRRGKNIIARSFVTKFAYLQNTADQAIYPTPSQTTYSLSTDEAYILTFSGKPPIKSIGFWSITIYNSEGFLIGNPQNIYALGDRSNLTYSDGTKLYGSSEEKDKPFQILVQSTDAAPPSNWTSNWLPSPRHGEKFQLTLRLYAPLPAAGNGAYIYPKFSKQKAIRH